GAAFRPPPAQPAVSGFPGQVVRQSRSWSHSFTGDATIVRKMGRGICNKTVALQFMARFLENSGLFGLLALLLYQGYSQIRKPCAAATAFLGVQKPPRLENPSCSPCNGRVTLEFFRYLVHAGQHCLCKCTHVKEAIHYVLLPLG